jgi:electron transfer flavoprotein alpha subunit
MSKVLVIGEHNDGKLSPAVAKCVSCAQGITGAEISIALLGSDTQAAASQAAEIAGVAKVLRVDRPENAHPLAAVYAPQIVALAADFTHVLGSSSTVGKDLTPRVAALLGVPQVSDVMSVQGAYRFVRPTYAGNAITTVEADPSKKLVATVRVASFQAAAGGGKAAIESRTLTVNLPAHTRFIGTKSGSTDRPDLQTAARVVSGGRALASADNFQILYRLADKLGAAVGASRAAVDAGYAPNELQVGQTGKIIAPELYVACGISGAIQHLTGIKDARTIVAINKDSEAPIFEVADIGLVGDLFQVVPELERLLSGA